MAEVQRSYSVEPAAAGRAFDQQLVKETGMAGFAGYMLLRAREGESYTSYILDGGIPIHEFRYTLKSTGAWIYWLIEALIIIILPAWLGFDVGQRPFSLGATNWYEPSPQLIGTVSLDNKEQFLRLLSSGALQEAGELIAPEGQMKHPTIEVMEQYTEPKSSHILLSVKQTQRASPGSIKRTILRQWELTPVQSKTLGASLNTLELAHGESHGPNP
jgi:hypothetical protein